MDNTVMNATASPFLELQKISMIFGHTVALNEMDFSIRPGEIVGVVGSNGAGKSTLMKVITGVYTPSAGSICLGGESINPKQYTANEAKRRGIACAYQELSLCSNLNAYENFSISHMDHSPLGRHGWRKRAEAFASETLEAIFPHNHIDIKTPLSELKLSQRQMIEIARAISTDGLKLLILDEPTASLTADRIDQLHAHMKKLSQEGIAIIYISHKLDEIDRICDRIVVMQAGKNILSSSIADITPKELIEIMGGKAETASHSKRTDHSEAPAVLTIQHLNTDALHDINLTVHQGEIIGVSGLAGSGQKELLLAIFNAQKKRQKAIQLATRASFVSGDRNNEGIFPLWNIADNTLISSHEQVSSAGILSPKRFASLAQYWYDKLKFKAAGIKDDITSLSGGNQQKALIARGICADAGIIILNDSTCGVDIETKQEIYRLLYEARSEGKTVIWHSTEDLEMELCDRILVMHEGRIVRELQGEDVSVKNIVTTSFEYARKSNAEQEQTADSQKKRSFLPKVKRILQNRATLPIFVMALIFSINSFINPNIASYRGINMLYSSAVPLVFIALGQMFLVISGGIDMGNGIAVGLTNVLFAFVVSQSPITGVLGLALFIIAYGALGALIYVKRMPAIVVTLGASYIWRGIGLIIAPNPGGTQPAFIDAIFGFRCPIIPTPILMAIAAGLLCWWITKRSKYGLIICGCGNNPTAIARAGWSRLIATVVTYMISGALIVLAGMSMTYLSKGGDINSTSTYQMLSIATIILGGCEFVGGIASPVGVTAAALAISSISTLLTMINVDSNLQSAVTGLILIAALAIKLVPTVGRRKTT